MVVKNTIQNNTVAQAVSSMAIEDMYVSRAFIVELLKVANGEKSSEELRQEVLKKYAR